MPDRDWPPVQRLLARFIRTAMYAVAAVAGVSVLADPPQVGGEISPEWAVALALVGLLSGSVAAAGSAAHRWQMEWSASWLVGAAFAGYAILELASHDEGTAAALTFGALACWARGVDLWVFSLTASRARRARVRSWRRAAGLDR